MARVKGNGLEFEYVETGPSDGPVVMHISGFASQLTRWAEEFFDAMGKGGYRYLRFDNRDAGLSSKMDHLGVPNVMDLMARSMAGEAVEGPYTLYDMADDVIAVMDGLGIDKAHIQGESMGGMIAQIVAGKYPDRCHSLISVMSTTSRPGLPQATPEAQAVLFRVPEDPFNREEVVGIMTDARQVLASPGYDPGPGFHREHAEQSYERNYHPSGPPRQMAAIIASGQREDLLKSIRLPTLILHGADDNLLPPGAGEDLKNFVPHARVKIVEGMSHSVEPGLAPVLADIVQDFLAGVESSR